MPRQKVDPAGRKEIVSITLTSTEVKCVEALMKQWKVNKSVAIGKALSFTLNRVSMEDYWDC